MRPKTFLFMFCAAAALSASAGFAQERAAGGPVDTQMTWSALSDIAKAASDKAGAVNTRVDQVVICGKKGMNYAPGVGDAQGCVEASKAGDVSTNITKISNNLTTTMTNLNTTTTNVNNILKCQKTGGTFNGTTCVAPASTTPTGDIAVSYQECALAIDGGTNEAAVNIYSGNAGLLYCPKDYVMVGTNTKSVGSALCCKLKFVGK